MPLFVKSIAIWLPAGVLNKKLERSADVMIYAMAFELSYTWKPHEPPESKAPDEFRVSNADVVAKVPTPRLIDVPCTLRVSFVDPMLMVVVLLVLVAMFTVLTFVPFPMDTAVVDVSDPMKIVPDAPEFIFCIVMFELLMLMDEQLIAPFTSNFTDGEITPTPTLPLKVTLVAVKLLRSFVNCVRLVGVPLRLEYKLEPA